MILLLSAIHKLKAASCCLQLTNLELGFPAQVTHVITPNSFLYDQSLIEMDTGMMEVGAKSKFVYIYIYLYGIYIYFAFA